MADPATPQTDDFEQYKRPPQAAEGDEFAQYKRPAAPEQEGAGTRFLHSAGLPASTSEIMPALKSIAAPEASKEHPGFGQTIPVIGPMFRAQRETWDQPGAWGKVYGSLPAVGPPGYRMGKQIESGDYAGAAGSGVNIATQMLGLRGEAPAIAEATHDIAAPVVRGTVKGINAGLEKAPGTVGAAVGGGIAHEVGLPPWMGATAGYGLGHELLPKLKIPGEKFGTAPRMPNPTFFTKGQDPFLRSPGIEGETPPVERAAFANKDFVGQRPNLVPTPMVGTVPATQVYPRGSPRLLPAAPDTAINPGPGEVIPPTKPAPYRVSGSRLTQPTTVTPRQVIPPSRQLTTGEVPIAPGRGTFMRDPRTNEQILQGVQDNLGGGQGKVATQEAVAPVKSTEWPPAVRGPVVKLPDKAAIADRLETRSMQEAIREAAENEERSGLSQEKREWFARNQPGTPKGDLVAQSKARFSETPPVQPKPQLTGEDLIKALQAMAAKKKK